MKTIEINGTSLNVKVNFRSMMEVEKLTGKPFGLTTTTDIMLFAYSILKVNNESFTASLDDFIDICDEKPSVFVEMTQIITDEMTSNRGDDKPEKAAKKK